MAGSVDYYDGKTGQTKKGYFVDGHTYEDEAGTVGVSVGSRVRTPDGNYYERLADGSSKQLSNMGGSPGAVTPGMQQFLQGQQTSTGNNYINSMYDAQNASNMSALDAAYNQSVNNINASKSALPQTYNEARNTTAAQAGIAKNNFNEYAAGSGLNSGTGGQAQLAMGNQLQGNLSKIDTAQSNAMSALDLKLADLKSQYSSEATRLIAEGNFQKLSAIYQQYQTNSANAINEQHYQDSQKQNQSNADMQKDSIAYDRAAAAANASGLYDGMAAYGWTPEQISSANEAAAAKRTMGSGSGGGGGGSAEKPVLTLAQVNEAIKAKNLTPNVIKAYEYYYGAPFQQAANPRQQIADTAQQLKSEGMSDDEIMTHLTGFVRRGEISSAEAQQLIALLQ